MVKSRLAPLHVHVTHNFIQEHNHQKHGIHDYKEITSLASLSLASLGGVGMVL